MLLRGFKFAVMKIVLNFPPTKQYIYILLGNAEPELTVGRTAIPVVKEKNSWDWCLTQSFYPTLNILKLNVLKPLT